MKTLSRSKAPVVLSLLTISFLAAIMWSAGQSVAAVPENVNAKPKQEVFVQDSYDQQSLQMKLIIHRPGQAFTSAANSDRS